MSQILLALAARRWTKPGRGSCSTVSVVPEVSNVYTSELTCNTERYFGLTPQEAAETDFSIDEKDWIFDLYWVS